MEKEKFEMLLNDYEVEKKLIDVFVEVAEKLGYEFEEIADVISTEITMENIDIEPVIFLIFKSLKNWYEKG